MEFGPKFQLCFQQIYLQVGKKVGKKVTATKNGEDAQDTQRQSCDHCFHLFQMWWPTLFFRRGRASASP